MKFKKIDVTDIEGFHIGNAENIEAGTGCTVVICEDGAVAGVDVRGGAPATRETDLLRSENTVDKIHAVVLSGGSAFGLEAASGVMKSLADKGIGFKFLDYTVPIVSGASLFDLQVGTNEVLPDVEMGREAVNNAYEGTFENGNHGAGTGATVGKSLGIGRAMKTGIGTFACSDEVVQVGAITAVNALGDVYNGAGNIIAGLRSEDGTSILGSIKVLKDMIRPDQPEELTLDDIKSRAADERAKHEEGKSAGHAVSEKSDIALAIQQAYEHSLEEVEEEPVIPAEAVEEEVIEEPVEEVTEESIEETEEFEELTVAEETPEIEYPDEPAEETAADSEPEPEPEPVQEEASEEPAPEYYPEPEPESEPEQETEPAEAEPAAEEPEEIDPYELSEEEAADMGYDVPFNTTISCLLTNARMTKSQANKLASILHDAYARAIKPVHSTSDGDTIFVMSTCTEDVNFDAFAALATDVLQYAIIDAAQSAEGAYGLPAARDIIRR